MTGPDPRVAAVRAAVRAELADVGPGQLVLVACSGGADSLALAAGTAFVAPRAGLRAGAVVVDHGWFDDSATVAATAAGQCRALGLEPVDVVRVDAAPTGQGPEAAAREARYAALRKRAADAGAAAVLLGHTLDDQAETVLLALARGSGARSLAGMPLRRGIFRRPLLNVPRDDVQATCDVLALTPWDDPSNADPRLARSRVRSVLLPVLESELGPGVAAALARTARLLRADAEVLDRLAHEALARARTGSGPGPGDGELSLDVDRLAREPDGVRWRVLRLAAVSAGSPPGSLAHRHVLALDALVRDWHGQGEASLPGGVAAVRAYGRLSLARR
ncbi:MAG: tRNA lysidine(34) synthetase TilS [Actinomycetes bacterium]